MAVKFELQDCGGKAVWHESHDHEDDDPIRVPRYAHVWCAMGKNDSGEFVFREVAAPDTFPACCEGQ